MTTKSMSIFVQTLLIVVLVSVTLLFLFSTIMTTLAVAKPGSFIYELKQKDNRLDYPEMHISIKNWRQVPDNVQRTILLRQNLSGPIYLLFCILFILTLRKTYKSIVSKQQYTLSSAKKIQILGLLPLLYVSANFLITLVLNLVIFNFSKSANGIHVGSRHIPEFNFELFIFGLIIMVFADVYIQISAIKDDLELTV